MQCYCYSCFKVKASVLPLCLWNCVHFILAEEGALERIVWWLLPDEFCYVLCLTVLWSSQYCVLLKPLPLIDSRVAQVLSRLRALLLLKFESFFPCRAMQMCLRKQECFFEQAEIKVCFIKTVLIYCIRVWIICRNSNHLTDLRFLFSGLLSLHH